MPYRPDVHRFLGDHYLAGGDPERALREYDALLGLVPRGPGPRRARYGMARAALAGGDRGAARREVLRSLERRPVLPPGPAAAARARGRRVPGRRRRTRPRTRQRPPMSAPMSDAVPSRPRRPAALVEDFRRVTARLRSEVGRIVVGQDEVVEHLLITLLVGGHCLVTGMPGTAKTLLVRTLADALGLRFDRIQFTPRSHADRHHRHRHHRRGRARPPRVALRAGADLHERAAGRRDQPNAAEDAGRAARGDAGVLGHGARHPAPRSTSPFSCSRRRTRSSSRAPTRCPSAQLDRFLFDIILD